MHQKVVQMLKKSEKIIIFRTTNEWLILKNGRKGSEKNQGKTIITGTSLYAIEFSLNLSLMLVLSLG